jgi:hypothetical protein
MDRAPIVEDEELVLRALVDAHDPPPAKRGERASRYSATQCRMKCARRDDPAADDRAPDASRGALDLRQLRHGVVASD